MKRNLLLLNVLLLSSFLSSAQYWTIQNLGMPGGSRGVTDISIVDPNTAWVICYDGSGANMNVLDFSRTTDGGITWTAGLVGSDTTFGFSNLCALSDSEAWVCMFDQVLEVGGGLWHTVDAGTTWNQSGTGAIFDAASFPDFVHFKDAMHGVAFGDPNVSYFEIYTTVDGGNVWTRTPQANTPTPISGEFGIVNVFATSGDTIWAGTNKGRILRSVDYGLNWTAVQAAVASRTVSDIAFIDNMNGLAILYSGTTTLTYYLYKTVNGGTTWAQVTPIGGNWFKQYISGVPGTSNFVSTSLDFTTLTSDGSSKTSNLGSNWATFETGVQRGKVKFFDSVTGWCGDFSDAILTTEGGIAQWTGGPVGVKDQPMVKAELVAFPNPSNGRVTLNFKNKEAADIKLNLINAIGVNVFSHTIKNTVMVNESFDFSYLPKGIYLMNFECGSERTTERLIIQ